MATVSVAADVEQSNQLPRAPAPDSSAAVGSRRWRRPRLDRFELGLLAILAILSLWVVGLDLWQVVVHGRVWTGTDGVYVVDQLQYLSWIRSASEHFLSANLFVLRPTPADYFQPAVTVSAGMVALGVAPWLALLLWKPVAVLAGFFAFRAYVRGTIDGLWAQRISLTLALFFASATVVYGSFTTLGDLYPGFLSWGYTFGLLALAAIVAALVIYGRDRETRPGQPLARPPRCAGLAPAPLARRASDRDPGWRRADPLACGKPAAAEAAARAPARDRAAAALLRRARAQATFPGTWRGTPASTRSRYGRW